MGKINADWHAAHPMPQKATLDQRADWHLAHAAHCACRPVPRLVAEALARRGIAIPERRESDAGSPISDR